MREIDEATATAFQLQRRLDECRGEAQSGLFKEADFEQVMADINAYCASLKDNLFVPKWLVHSMLVTSRALRAEAPMHGAKANQVIAMTQKMDILIEAILTDRTLEDFTRSAPALRSGVVRS